MNFLDIKNEKITSRNGGEKWGAHNLAYYGSR
jgi:hypothetical protein